MDFLKLDLLNKVHEEMKKKHSTTEREIADWVSDQNADSLKKGFLKPEKSIKEAMLYCNDKAYQSAVAIYDEAPTNNDTEKPTHVSMISRETVYSWLKEYILSDTKNIAVLPKTIISHTNTVTKTSKKKSTNIVNINQGEQLSFLDELL